MSRPAAPKSPATPPITSAAPSTAPFGSPTFWWCVFLVLAVFAAYLPALGGAFLWDDEGHVTRADLRSFGGLLRIWFEPGVTQQYYPLLHSAFWLEHQLWGDATLGYHLVNILQHAANACLFGLLLRRLAVRGAWFAAALFALHPVCVESVAWISEQKNTLSALFYLSAALAYVRFDDERRPKSYALASGLFLLALLTKTVTATLPAALLVIAWWRRGRLDWRRDILPLLPWFAAGIAAGLFTAWFERTGIGAQGADFNLSFLERGLLAGRIFWFYLGQLIWPADLMFFYPRWQIDAGAAWQYLFLAATLALLGALAWWTRHGRDRGVPAAFLLFGGTLFPALGFVNVYPFVFSYVADHFQYHASLAIVALVAAAATRGWERLSWPPGSGLAAVAVLLALIGALTWQQSATYRDVFALYESTLARNPDSWVAHLNLGIALDDAGQTDEALPHLQRANALKPDFPETLNSLGNVLNRLARPAEARPLLERAVQLQPRFASAHNTLGACFMALGQSEAGLVAFRRAVEIDPKFTTAQVNLGWALANAGRIAEALSHLEHARRAQPESADVEFKIGLTYAVSHRHAEAVPHLERALALDENHAQAHLQLALALRQLGRVAEANDHYRAAIELNPALGR